MTLNNRFQNTTLNSWVTFTVIGITFILIVASGVFIGTHSSLQITQVNGSSMEPTLTQNDLIIGFSDTTIEQGEIIIIENSSCFEYPYVIHRVTHVTENGYITQGDNNQMSDQALNDCEVIHPTQVHSKAEYKIRFH